MVWRSTRRIGRTRHFVDVQPAGSIRRHGWAAATSPKRPASGGEETGGEHSAAWDGARRNALHFSPYTCPLDGFERAFARGERELPLLKALKGAIIAAKPLESDVCRLMRASHSNAGQPNDRQDQMAIRGLLGGILFVTVGAIVPAGAQTPPSSSPPQAPQVPGKTPQERCYYRYMTAHGYHHVGPKAQAACPDPNQEQPNPD